MLNIVVPMAGRGSRFASAGFELPKPLIPVHGKPMISLVTENVRPSRPHRFIFLCLAEHLERFPVAELLEARCPGAVVVPVRTVTEGAACTVLLAREHFYSEDALLIANSDQWVDVAIDDFLAAADRASLDGLIMTMRAADPKWSFVRFRADGLVGEVVEKVVVSDEATVGIYHFRSGRRFAAAADAMIAAGQRVNGEYYVAPVYNALIADGARVGCYSVGAEDAGMYGLGVPQDLARFLANPISLRATAF
jgi:NDP-sugar pyrophosphorylase family protein